ncbi:MAG: carboxypeptidase regulatory-like domain-containing protein [Acidobacteriota bacterium]|nr:carboxypeptidase regulatory-like domain-containing protein [Acidobacteriota bacterium]
MRNQRFLAVAFLALLISAPALLAQGFGRLDGRVAKADGKGVGGVTVVIDELGRVELTDQQGAFSFDRVAAGTYTVTFTLGEDSMVKPDVKVDAGATTTLDEEVDWSISFLETITVYSASRRAERIVEAPAAVTTIPQETIQREAAHGQLPKLLENSPGAEATQSGVYDFNFNARGFNSSLNRRILVLIDGRDPSSPFLGSQEWSTRQLHKEPIRIGVNY